MKKAARKKSARRSGEVTLASLEAKLDSVIDAMATRQEFQTYKAEVNERLDRIEKNIERLVTAIDALSKKVEALTVEYHVINRQMDRYDRWFKEIAEKTGIELKP